ncbi:MAG: M28 family metallopeptidase, partial [Promethearchaeota archaeon]
QSIQRVYGTNLASEIYLACDSNTYRSYVQGLSEIGPRFYRYQESSLAARNWIEEQLNLVSNGRIEVSLVGSYNNVVGRLPGYLPGDHPVLVVSAHYDSGEDSPGANDDGSGVAVVLELARVMSQYEWPLDIYFCAFNAAIPPLWGQPSQGSIQVAQAWSAEGIEVLALYNIDSILYPNWYSDPNSRVLLGYASSTPYRISHYWADLAEMMGNLYGIDVIQTLSSDTFPNWLQLDHIRFYERGYQSVVCAYESGYLSDGISGGPNDVYAQTQFNYPLGRHTAGAIGASMAFTMSWAYGEPTRHDLRGIITAGSTRTFDIAITTPTTLNVTCRWWSANAAFTVYDPNWNQIDGVTYPNASAWGPTQVLSTSVSSLGMYRVVMRNLGESSLGYEMSIQYDSDVNGNGIIDKNEYWLSSSLFQTDSDLDQLSDAMEIILGTNPEVADSDSDSIPDGWEYEYGLNPLNATDALEDFDGDNISNLDEFTNSLNPLSSDTDQDMMPDDFELKFGLNPLVNDAGLDPDGDGKTNLEEYLAGTNPQVPEQEPLNLMPVLIPSSAIILICVGAYVYRKYSNLMGS